MSIAMKRVVFFIASGFLVTEGVRVSETDLEQDHEASGVNPKKFAKQLVKIFTNKDEFPDTRDALAAIRQTEMQGGASDNERKFQYLGTSCMQQRAHWAAEKFKEQGCKRILEVGGFFTPLPTIVKKKEIPKLELYVDVDPSASKSEENTFNQTYPSVTLQIILEEFRRKDKDGNKIHMGQLFDCFLMLGTTAQNVGDDAKKSALKDALAKSKMAIIEYPSSNPDTPGHFMDTVRSAGMDMTEQHNVNCKDDKDAWEKKGEGCDNGSCLDRNMVLFKRGGGKN